MAFYEVMEEELLPPGFMFEPSDKLLLCHFLISKIKDQPLQLPQGFDIPELDLYERPPWELFHIASASRYIPDGIFYCFVRVKRSSARDRRLKRKTRGGTWVTNGTSCNVLYNGNAVAGTRTALKFFRDGDERRSKKDRSLGTNWIMHEYRLRASLYEEISSFPAEEIILCRIHRKRSRKSADVDPNKDDEQESSVTPVVAPVAVTSPEYSSDAGLTPMADWEQSFGDSVTASYSPEYISDAGLTPMADWEQSFGDSVTVSYSGFDYDEFSFLLGCI